MRKTVIAGAILMALGAITPAATAAPTTGVTAVSATVGTSVAVTGAATFVDVPALVGQDGDGANPNGIGADVRDISISRPAGNGPLTFTLAIDDQPPGLAASPAIVYLWPLMVNDNDNCHFLMAGRAGGFPSPRTDGTPGFAVMQNAAGGFSVVSDIEGKMADGVVQWKVPLSMIGAKAGDRIAQGGCPARAVPSGIRPGIFQLVWGGSPAHEDFFMEEEYTVPGNSVKLGIAPAGTAPEAVALTNNATVANSGSFAGTLAKPTTAGDYVVVARACYGPDNCGLSSTTITVV